MTPSEIALFLIKYDDLMAIDRVKQAVELECAIKTALKHNFDSYPIDLILETLDHLGMCINLLADNSGNWIVNCEEMREFKGCYVFPISENAEKEWRPSIREAVWVFVSDVFERRFKPEDFIEKDQPQ